ncbi:hypothetical protein QA645_18180 [Bradyrhizobium sp. CIAT3101]|uniref:hypothetical protein n=1 Tax=Bradyrhizobium sp. CIAT3101 TaxID=439387 RepID=UPI0024B200F8|nr:hypothetical protein [Bradyrhizobium sp. CIAT3101]WFU84591.1 hypothetical protein QA645_18180 [Bradyrhizobium sp. CIAT3101]
MVKTEVSARVSSWLFFLNRTGLLGKRGNIPSGERAAGWRKCGPIRLPLHRHCERSEAIQSLSADAFLDCFAALAMTKEAAEILKVFCPTAQAIFVLSKEPALRKQPHAQ